jgi:hypothetical protein
LSSIMGTFSPRYGLRGIAPPYRFIDEKIGRGRAALRLGIVPSSRIPLLEICLQISGKQFFYKEEKMVKEFFIRDERLQEEVKKYYPPHRSD